MQADIATWRPTLASRVGLWTLVLLGVGCFVFVLPESLDAGPGGLAATAALFLVPMAIPAIFATRCQLSVDDERMAVRNFLSERCFPLREVTTASAGYAGIAVGFRDGTSTTAMAVMKSNAAELLGARTRGDQVAEEILRRAEWARRSDRPAP